MELPVDWICSDSLQELEVKPLHPTSQSYIPQSYIPVPSILPTSMYRTVRQKQQYTNRKAF